jgi:hypothetical protein
VITIGRASGLGDIGRLFAIVEACTLGRWR